jgi:hypothetical protein
MNARIGVAEAGSATPRPLSVDEAVGVARGVTALEPRLVHAQAAEVVPVREEVRVESTSSHAA